MMRTPPPGCGAMEHHGTMKTGTRANPIMGAVCKPMWPSMLTRRAIGTMKTKKERRVSSVITEVSSQLKLLSLMFRNHYKILNFSACESGWTSFGHTGHCYHYFPALKSWNASRSFCQSAAPPGKKGDLASGKA